jgi:outer membrane protein assembly factor BamB
LTALNASNGTPIWQYDSGAPILTSPSLSVDGQIVFLGNEAIQAIAVRASDGGQLWRTALQGQSLADRYPVVLDGTVIYRSQPLYYFHTLLHEGDEVMDQAGAVNSDWSIDWSNVRPQIVNYLTTQPSKQTFFVLNASNGTSRGVTPVLYTYGNNDPPNTPVIRSGATYVTYRARHGIQTDSIVGVHVTSKYDAELGQMNLSTLDIVGLRQASGQNFGYQFRMTSDEPAMLSMGGDILWVDNWERLGGINVATRQLVHVGDVSNDWPECGGQCSPGSLNPYFPLSGNPSNPA